MSGKLGLIKMERLEDILFSSLGEILEDIRNIIIEFINEYSYEKEQELKLKRPDILDMKICGKNLLISQYNLGDYKEMDCWNVETYERDTKLLNNINYYNISISSIEWIEWMACICDNKLDTIYLADRLLIISPFFMIKYGKIKKLMANNDIMVIQNKNWEIIKLKYVRSTYSILEKYKKEIKFENYDFYIYEDKIYLLNMHIKKMLIYDLDFNLIKDMRIESKKTKNYDSKNIRMIIKDEIIYVNDGKKLLILNMEAKYISEINYNKKKKKNLSFCVNNNKIYLSIKNEILIYKQIKKSEGIDIMKSAKKIEIIEWIIKQKLIKIILGKKNRIIICMILCFVLINLIWKKNKIKNYLMFFYKK